MRASKKRRRNLAAERLAHALQQIADPEREKILVRLQKMLDSARKKVLGAPPKGRRKSTGQKAALTAPARPGSSTSRSRKRTKKKSKR